MRRGYGDRGGAPVQPPSNSNRAMHCSGDPSVRPIRGRRHPNSPQPGRTVTDDTLVLVCVNCARVVVFGPEGWAHGQGSADCPMLVVAWPPPGSEDEDAADDAA